MNVVKLALAIHALVYQPEGRRSNPGSVMVGSLSQTHNLDRLSRIWMQVSAKCVKTIASCLFDNWLFSTKHAVSLFVFSFSYLCVFCIFVFFCGTEWSVRLADGTGCDSSCWPTLPPHLLPESQTREGDSACHRSPPQPACTHTCTNTTHTCAHTSLPTSLLIPMFLNI